MTRRKIYYFIIKAVFPLAIMKYTLSPASATMISKKRENFYLIGLYHSLDGITNPKYKLLYSLTTKFFCKEKKALAFN